MRFSRTFTSVIASSLFTLAVAEGDNAGDVSNWFPPITRPAGGETYQAGSKQIAAWNRAAPSGFNVSAAGKYADLLLGYTTRKTPVFHLDIILVPEIPIFEGVAEVEYTIPKDLPTRNTYFLALSGSSATIGPTFSIQGLEGTPPAQDDPEPEADSEDEADPGEEEIDPDEEVEIPGDELEIPDDYQPDPQEEDGDGPVTDYPDDEYDPNYVPTEETDEEWFNDWLQKRSSKKAGGRS
ncbi:uncharacterized protein JCM6883_003184 [Sporobolomyces salmoneus]|uniref:uncharacterized protein n=1 Tax=Sporobolomyces salmoneus TaxID=183962 RepID=UPI00317AA2A7